MRTRRSETNTQRGAELSDAAKLNAILRELRRAVKLLRGHADAYRDLDAEEREFLQELDELAERREQQSDDFDEDELGIDPEEGL